MTETPANEPDPLAKLLAEVKQDYDHPYFRKSADPVAAIREHCRSFDGQIFISHTAADSDWCRTNLVRLIRQRFGIGRYFFLSIAIGPLIASGYRFMVEFGMQFSKTVILAVSTRSIKSDWVKLEARWAIEQKHPIILCLIENVDPTLLHPGLNGSQSLGAPFGVVSYYLDRDAGRDTLADLLDQPQFKPEPTIYQRGEATYSN